MAIDVPELDDRSYEQLLEEATKRLPAYDDGWTDYNPSDPGIAILELLAHLTETYLYQLDSVTDDHREKYLRLIGERRQPATSASVTLSLGLPEAATVARVPAGTRLIAVDGSESEKPFETTHDLVVTDATIQRVVTVLADGRVDHSYANGTEGMFYRAFGDRAEPGSALYLGFDGDPFERARRLSVSVAFHDEDLPELATHGDESPRFYPSVSLVWEYCTDYGNADSDEAWGRLAVTRDSTYAFYRSGTVTLERSDDWTPDEWGVDEAGVVGEAPGFLWIRCRVLEADYEVPPQFDSLRLNVATASHRSTVEDEPLLREDPIEDPATLTSQTYRFRTAPVLEASLTVDDEPWTEVDDFDASGPMDRHYRLDAARGRVQFGDGVNGRMPRPTATVRAEQYVAGGGRDGNVPAASVWRFADTDERVGEDVTLGELSVTAEDDAAGGADAESLDAAFRRVRRDLKTPYRAVTVDDYRYVATHTPGLRFGRATVLTEGRADLGMDDDPVQVTVVVVPYAPPDLSRPEPSDGFLDAVRHHVDRHRLLTDRVRVEPPDYVGLTVEVELQTLRWYPESRVERAVEAAITEYIDPLRGFEGEGWPFGRPLYKEELFEVIADVGFVDHVRDVSVRARGNARVDGEENVLIDEATLFSLDGVRAEVLTRASDRDGE